MSLPRIGRRSPLCALGTGAARARRAWGARGLWGARGPGRVDLSARDGRRLSRANWPLRIDTDDEGDSRRPTLEAFEERTGIAVTLLRDVTESGGLIPVVPR